MKAAEPIPLGRVERYTRAGTAWPKGNSTRVLLAAGLLVGLPFATSAALSLAAFLESQLFQVSTLDPLIFMSAVATISAITVLASSLPARRATKVDPMTALRCD